MTRNYHTAASVKTILAWFIVPLCFIVSSCQPKKPLLSGTYVSDEKTITGHPCYTVTFLGPDTAKFNDYSLIAKVFDNPFFGGEKEFSVDYSIDRDTVEFRRTLSSETLRRNFKLESGNSVLRDEWDVFRKR